MVESNYPDVVKIVTKILAQFDSQVAKYPDQPLNVNVKQYPIVQNNTISNRQLDGTGFAISLNDVYLGPVQDKMDLSKNNIRIEPGMMAQESEKYVVFDLQHRDTSIPTNGLNLLRDFFFSIYGRVSDLVVTNIYHPESIVANILTGEALVPIWNRAKSDMISQAMTNYPVAGKFNTAAFVAYMNRFSNDMEINDFFIKSEKFRVNLNSLKSNFENGGVWGENLHTFGTWSSFPEPGDFMYGVSLAGMIIGILDNTLTGANRVKFKAGRWEEKIRFLCLAASMNNYTFSYIFDYVKPA